MSAAVDPATVPVRPAATVMLVRDAEDGTGPEVFMMRRTLQAAFARGMYVFPGGRLDNVDGGPAMEALCEGLTDARASALLQIESGGLAYWVAAIRECFEEAGVLLARSTATGEYIRFDDPQVESRFNAARHLIHDSSLGLIELCATEGLRLATDTMFYVAHWITPLGEARRFDTRFFLARAPQAQEPLHDDGETIASTWVKPADGLARAQAGELVMMHPTISCLRFLEPHRTADGALVAASAIGVPPCIEPKLVRAAAGDRLAVVLPGEAGYDEMT